MVRLSGFTQASELTRSTCVLQLLRPRSDSVPLEFTLTKTLVCWRGLSKTWDTAAAGFQSRAKASVSRVLEPEMSLLSGLQNAFSHWFVLSMFVLCYSLIDNLENAHKLQNILLYTVLSKSVMEKWFFFFLLSLKIFFVAWMKDRHTVFNTINMCNHIYNRIG